MTDVCIHRVGSTRSANVTPCTTTLQLHPRPMDCSSGTGNQDSWIRARLRGWDSGRVSTGAWSREASAHHQSFESVYLLISSLYLAMYGVGLAIYRSRVRVLTGHHCVVALGKLYLYLCASVTKQYNLVPAKGVISLAGKVTAGLVESNGSLPSGLWLISMPNARNRVWDYFTFLLRNVSNFYTWQFYLCIAATIRSVYTVSGALLLQLMIVIDDDRWFYSATEKKLVKVR